MLKTVLLNRATIVLGTLAVAIIVWNIYIAGNDDGILVGTVVDVSGQPVTDAKVVASELSLISRNVIDIQTTDETGQFRFDRHDHHAMVLQATKDGVGNSRRVEVRLYYQNQNKTLSDALVLDPDVKQGPLVSEQSGSN